MSGLNERRPNPIKMKNTDSKLREDGCLKIFFLMKKEATSFIGKNKGLIRLNKRRFFQHREARVDGRCLSLKRLGSLFLPARVPVQFDAWILWALDFYEASVRRLISSMPFPFKQTKLHA